MVIVWLALNVTEVIPTDVRPANDRVLNVFAPVIVMLVAAALVKLKLLKVKPPPANVGPVVETEMLDVPALNVKFVVVVKVTFPASVTVLPFKEIDRTFALDDDKVEADKE